MFLTLNENSFRKEIMKDSKLIIIEIGAPWCGTCFIMEPILNRIVMDFHHEIIIKRLDINECENIVREYGIQRLPTYLFFQGGQLVDQVIGPESRERFSARINFLIN